MGVTHEYFLADTDESAARLLDTGPAEGVLGPDPVTELVALEAILTGLDPSGDEALQLVTRPGNGAIVANDGTDSVLVVRVLPDAVSLIAAAEPAGLDAAMHPWAQIEEFAGRVTPAELAEVTGLLRALFDRALTGAHGVYVRTSL